MAERTQLGELGEAAKHREKITPSSAQVWKEFEGARNVDATDVVPAKRKHRLQWVKRRAKRHNIRRGKFGVGSAVPRDLALRKAAEYSMESAAFFRRLRHFFLPFRIAFAGLI
jgi:hypothetical protein